MKLTTWFLVVLVVVGLVSTACGGDDDDAVVGGADVSDDDSSDSSDESDDGSDDSDESDDSDASDDATEDSDASDDAADEATDESDEAASDEETTTTFEQETTATAVDSTEDTTSVFELAVGDCINTDALTGSVSEVGSLDCGAPHDFEIYYAFDIADGDFPGEEAISAQAETQCLGDAFASYVGLDYNSSTFYVQPLTPTVESWAAGDREVLCMLYATNDNGVTVAPYTGSAQGSGL